MTCTHTSALVFRAATKSGSNQTGPNCVEVANFTKATASNPSGNCVEVTHAKATKSKDDPMGGCVEPGVARDTHTRCTPDTCLTPGIQPGDIVVRDSKLGADSPLIVFTPDAWRGLTAVVVTGAQEIDPEGWHLMRDPRNPGLVLRFTATEWDAFRDGCTRGEFTYSKDVVSA